MNVVLAPHGDDETLFASYICMRKRAYVIVCTQDADPEVRSVRARETTEALTILGCSHHELPIPADDVDWQRMRELLERWKIMDPEKVYAPSVHFEGHEQHNRVGELAIEVFGEKVVPYLTYAPRGQRQRNGMEIIPTADEIARKLKALACYRTQIENEATRPWFFDLLDLREWLA